METGGRGEYKASSERRKLTRRQSKADGGSSSTRETGARGHK
jgi:hypothetical protein